MLVAQCRQYNIGEKPSVILYTYINRYAGTPKRRQKYTLNLDTTQLGYIGLGVGLKYSHIIGESESIVEYTSPVGSTLKKCYGETHRHTIHLHYHHIRHPKPERSIIYFFHFTYSRWAPLPSCLWSLRIFPSLPG